MPQSVESHTHIALLTDKQELCDDLVEVLRLLCPVRALTIGREATIAPTAICLIIDVDLDALGGLREFELLQFMARSPYLPLIFVIDRSKGQRSIDRSIGKAKAMGVAAFITRPFEASEVLRVLPTTYGLAFERAAMQRDGAAGLGVASAHAAVRSILESVRGHRPFTFDEVKAREDPILDALSASGVDAWLDAVRRHHSRTYQHSLLVTGFATSFAQGLKMRRDDQRRIARAALLHDVGKAFTPLSILDKPGKLTAEEMEEIKRHPVRGYDLLREQGGFPEEVLDCVRHHHELLDGTGYPDGLRGSDITDLVRIVTIADIYSALIETRAYKSALSPKRALEIMQKMGDKLDGDLLRAFRDFATEVRS